MATAYGTWLREQRIAAGLTQQKLAKLALMTRSHIAHIEAGRRLPSKEDAQRLDDVLNTRGVLLNFLPEEEPAVVDYFEAVRQLEEQACMIYEFAPSYVPGILQTERYARALLGAAIPPVSEEERDRRVVTRLSRAKIFDAPVPPVVTVLLDEALLRRPVCAPDIMAEQLMHLVHMVEAGRIRLHVLPLDQGHHPLMGGMLTLMWFEDQPPVAYTEGHGSGKLIDSPAVVRNLESRYTLALGNALALRESTALLRATAKEYGHRD